MEMNQITCFKIEQFLSNLRLQVNSQKQIAYQIFQIDQTDNYQTS